MDNDAAKRLQLLEYNKKGITIEKIARAVSEQMGIAYKYIHQQARNNAISAFRKIVAATAYRHYGIPLIKIAEFYTIRRSSVSRMIDNGEKCIEDYKIKLL